MHVGIAGEVRCVVTKADGKVKIDTGFQKNLILNQGLEFFGGGRGNTVNGYCAIGSGNSTPVVTQTKLDAFLALTSGTDTTSDYSYVDEGDGLYRMWEQKKYRFADLNDVNISELGLVSTGTTSANYYLTTRALIKDSLGAPTSISVKTGETLDIYYKFHKIIDTADKSYQISVLDGDGGTVPYNVVVRPAWVGSSGDNSVSGHAKLLPSSGYIFHSSSDLSANTSSAKGTYVNGAFSVNAYTPNTYSIGVSLSFDLNNGNSSIRSVSVGEKSAYSNSSYTFHPFQLRFGSVADDSPIVKTNKDILTIPLEFSWGRFEGEL